MTLSYGQLAPRLTTGIASQSGCSAVVNPTDQTPGGALCTTIEKCQEPLYARRVPGVGTRASPNSHPLRSPPLNVELCQQSSSALQVGH